MGKLPFPNRWDRASSSFWGYLLLKPLDLESPRTDAREGSHQWDPTKVSFASFSIHTCCPCSPKFRLSSTQCKKNLKVSKRRQRKENPSTSLTLMFNFCMDPLVKVICQDGVWYHQYTSILQIQETPGLDWENRFQLNSSKTIKLWVLNSPGSGDFLSFAFIGPSMSHVELVHPLKNFLDLWVLFEEQVIAVSRRAFVSCVPIYGMGGIIHYLCFGS